MTKKILLPRKPSNKIEKKLFLDGFKNICGVDEVGRGCIAGPLCIGLVLLPNKRYSILNDSKLLSFKKRKEISEFIKNEALDYLVESCSAEEIDRVGIQEATYQTIRTGLKKLSLKPDFILMDHYKIPLLEIPQMNITKGDRISQSIAAASILAKVARDEYMISLSCENRYKEYGFEKHFGYATREHLEVLKEKGPLEIHRKYYKPVDNLRQTDFNFS